MKRALMAAVVMAAGAVRAQDVTVRITATIPAAARAEMIAMIAADPSTFPPLYAMQNQVVYRTNAVQVVEGDVTNTVQVVTVTTNTVQVVVPETPKAKFVRLSAAVLESYWRRQLVRYRKDTQPVPVTVAPVTAVETP